MRFSQALATAALVTACVAAQDGALGDAQVVTNNPPGAVYRANFMSTIPWDTPDRGPVKADIVALSNVNGTGVTFKVTFQNLPKDGGPFPYHIHVDPVPEDGNCTATLGHLDPYIRGETPPCDSKKPQTCQVGDLSGKYGAAEGTNFTTSFTDDFASLVPGLGSFFGNRSIVIHFANLTRMACGNFSMIGSPTTMTYSDKSCTTTATYYGNGTMPTVSSTISGASGTGYQPTPTATGVVTVSRGNALIAKAPAALWLGTSLSLAALIFMI